MPESVTVGVCGTVALRRAGQGVEGTQLDTTAEADTSAGSMMAALRNRANTLHALNPYWQDIITGANRAERNIDELQPGFPATTPGNGSPGGGTRFNTTSITARLALNPIIHNLDPDPAQTADNEYKRIVALLKIELPKLRTLIVQWDYPTAGEIEAGATIRHVMDEQTNKHADPGCISCYRPEVLKWEPIHKAALCRWCYDFKTAEHILPPADLLKEHHRGTRMTRALVDRHIKAAKTKTVAPARTPRRKATRTPVRE